jgi:hypothetical protein
MKSSSQHVINCLDAGMISQQEAEYYLQEVHNMTLEQARGKPAQKSIPTFAYVLVGFFVMGLVGFFMQDGSGITGFVTLETPDILAVSNAAIGLNASGYLYGDGNATIIYETENGSFTLARLTSDDGSVRTHKASYLPEELVYLDNAPKNASFYLDTGASSDAVEIPFSAPAVNSTLLIVSEAEGAPVTTRIPVIIGDMRRVVMFTDICVDTCVLPGISGKLRIDTTGTAEVNITQLRVSTAMANRAPALMTEIPTISVNDVTAVDLASFFIDPDGDTLLFSTGSSSYVNTTVTGSILTLAPLQEGDETIMIYASDMHTLVPVALRVIVGAVPVMANTSSNATDIPLLNITQNTTVLQNTTSEVLQNNTAVPVANIAAPNASTETSLTLDCSNSDPNQRPVDCLNVASNTFFEEDIYLENTDRVQVARVTPIGNLVLKGRVLKRDGGTPGTRDFTIGYKDENFNYVPTIWIDGEGNLRLRGQLYEENENVIPPQGSYAVINRRGVYMAYAIPETGDLYLRGNAIVFREDIHE